MPRFYMHLHDYSGWVNDPEGQVLRDQAAAETIALSEARNAIAEDIKAGRPILLGSCIAVDNSEGVEVHRVTFAEAFSVVGL